MTSRTDWSCLATIHRHKRPPSPKGPAFWSSYGPIRSDEEVLALAKKHHCPIILSGHGTMNTSRYLYFAPPVKLIMLRSLISFNIDEFAEDVGKKMLKSRYRSYPVIDNNNYLNIFPAITFSIITTNRSSSLITMNTHSP